MRTAFALIFVSLWATCLHAESAGDAPETADRSNEPLLTELAWIAPQVDRIGVLTESRGECLRAPKEASQEYLVEVGAAAFASPFLLGGQAAREGLSCQSCHVNGHDNPAFLVAGLSDAPGTADVTSSIFSALREDHEFNPVQIPSLVGIKNKTSFGTQAPAPSIHAFIESAVTEEFQGVPPPETVLRGLTAYIEHLDPAACPTEPAPRTAERDLARVKRIFAAAGAALDHGDVATADFLILSGQGALGRIHERFAEPSLEPQRERLRSMSGALNVVRETIPDNISVARMMLARLSEQMPTLREDLRAHRRSSLYDVGVLRAALEAAE